MRIEVVSLFPGMFEALTGYGVTGRALDRGLLHLGLVNPREYATDNYRTVDDRPYGGGPGMVMMVEPLRSAIRAARVRAGTHSQVVYLSPQGRRLDQAGVRELAALDGLVLVCGRYEGIDERLVELEIDREVSVGDYVLSGGELPAMVLVDAIARLIPGSLGHDESAQQDSFEQGLLDHPHYTRPEVVEGRAVPPVLLSGDHAAIRRWRAKQALGRTWLRRPDLLKALRLDAEQTALLQEFIQEHEAK